MEPRSGSIAAAVLTGPLLASFLFPLAAVTAVVGGRWIATRAMEWRHARRRRYRADGIIDGAEGFSLPGAGRRAALLLHGFGDTPQTLRLLADHLSARGIGVEAPLLPGHGRRLRDFVRSDAEQWLGAARESYRSLRSSHDHVALVGLSMGGAIATLLAAEADSPALVLLAPYLAAPDAVRRLARHHRWLGALSPYMPSGDDRSIHDPEERSKSLGHGMVTAGLLRELVGLADRGAAAFRKLATPALIIHSRRDNRVPAADIERLVASPGKGERRIVWLEDCGHVITVDRERQCVFDETAGWLERHLRASIPAAAAG